MVVGKVEPVKEIRKRVGFPKDQTDDKAGPQEILSSRSSHQFPFVIRRTNEEREHPNQ